MKWISSAYIKILMKRNPLLQGNSEYELWKQTVEKVVDAMPSIDLELCEKCGRYRTKGRTCNIDEAPTIEPKHGEWIEDEQGEHKCSNCYAYAPLDGDEFWLRDKVRELLPNTCPNCGADMLKGADDE